jgi:hypothetical protein
VDWWGEVVRGCERAWRQYAEYAERPDADPHVLDALGRRAEWCAKYVR